MPIDFLQYKFFIHQDSMVCIETVISKQFVSLRTIRNAKLLGRADALAKICILDETQRTSHQTGSAAGNHAVSMSGSLEPQGAYQPYLTDCLHQRPLTPHQKEELKSEKSFPAQRCQVRTQDTNIYDSIYFTS